MGIAVRVCAGSRMRPLGLFATLGLVLVLMERKVAAYMQIRLGPNRVGPKGMFQSLADTIKLMMKEGIDARPGADKFLFNAAPLYVVMIAAMLLLAPIAFAKNFQIWDINIGVLYHICHFFCFCNWYFNGRLGQQ